MAIEDEVKQEVEALSAALATALNGHNHVLAAALFADDAFLLPPGRRMIQGHGEIETFWSNTTQRLREAGINITNVKLLGPHVVRGIGRLIMKFDGPQSQEVASKFLFVAQKSDMSWKIESFSWSRAASAPPRRAQTGQGRSIDSPTAQQGTYGNVSSLYGR